MSDKPLDELVQEKGACCLYGFMVTTGNQPRENVELILAVDPTTLSRVKRQILTGQCRCQHLEPTGKSPQTNACIFSASSS